jgi:hypothetical protein
MILREHHSGRSGVGQRPKVRYARLRDGFLGVIRGYGVPKRGTVVSDHRGGDVPAPRSSAESAGASKERRVNTICIVA